MNKASGGDGIPVELYQMLKGDAVKVLHSICWQVWQQCPQDWKRSVFIPIAKKANAKELMHFNCMFREIKENNRMGKTRDLFKKTGETKGTFHAKMEEKDIKKRW